MTIEDKMNVALHEAKKALEKGELPIGAAAFLDDKLLCASHTSEVEDRQLLVHAELKVLQQVDTMNIPFGKREHIELFTNLEPCMMCLGACVASFIGTVYYGLSSGSDGAANWAEKTWKEHHEVSAFQLPLLTGGIQESESRLLFEQYADKHKSGPMVEWVQTLL